MSLLAGVDDGQQAVRRAWHPGCVPLQVEVPRCPACQPVLLADRLFFARFEQHGMTSEAMFDWLGDGEGDVHGALDGGPKTAEVAVPEPSQTLARATPPFTGARSSAGGCATETTRSESLSGVDDSEQLARRVLNSPPEAAEMDRDGRLGSGQEHAQVQAAVFGSWPSGEPGAGLVTQLESLACTGMGLHHYVAFAAQWDIAHPAEAERPLSAEEQSVFDELCAMDEARHGGEYAEYERLINALRSTGFGAKNVSDQTSTLLRYRSSHPTPKIRL